MTRKMMRQEPAVEPGPPSRPLLRYHGGKWNIAPWIISFLPQHRIYVEPFGGGASVLIRKPRSYAEIYNDLDDELVNLFRVVRDRGDELREALRLTPYARTEFTGSYKRTRNRIEQARRTVVRSMMGFSTSGLGRKRTTGWRSNSSRSGSTPAADWSRMPDALDAIVDRLRGVGIENRPALKVIADHDGADTVHYVDPPYPLSVRDAGLDYTHEMTDLDHQELAAALRLVEGMVIVSGYRCELYDGLYRGWRQFTRNTYSDNARKRIETIWMNDAAAARMPQSQLF